jgi:hypothetical protein
MLSEALPQQSRAINSNQEQQTASKSSKQQARASKQQANSKQEQASQMILSGKNKSRQNVGCEDVTVDNFL